MTHPPGAHLDRAASFLAGGGGRRVPGGGTANPARSWGGTRHQRASGSPRSIPNAAARSIRFPARVQHPKGKPCIDAWGQRIQAFLGTATAGGKPALFADHFVFLAGVDADEVYRGIVELGVNTKTHYSRAEGRERAGRDFLRGDPVAIFVRWKDGDRWVERRYEDFAQEKVVVGGQEVIQPWAPHFVFHGSGVIHREGTGCIACPCDCPGGLIADDRHPIYEPKPVVRFDLSQAPPEGTPVEIRIRPVKGDKS